jgi:hypothetical protein
MGQLISVWENGIADPAEIERLASASRKSSTNLRRRRAR